MDRPVLGAEEGDQRSIGTLLADQVECANVIVINKVGGRVGKKREEVMIYDIFRHVYIYIYVL